MLKYTVYMDYIGYWTQIKFSTIQRFDSKTCLESFQVLFHQIYLGFLPSYRSDLSHFWLSKKKTEKNLLQADDSRPCWWYTTGWNNKKTYIMIFQKEGHLNTNDEDFWLVVEPTHLKKYARQIGSCPQVGVKIKTIWNHHLEMMRSSLLKWLFGKY